MTQSPNEQGRFDDWIDQLAQQEPEFVSRAMAFVAELKKN
jgi:hypothetical protein